MRRQYVATLVFFGHHNAGFLLPPPHPYPTLPQPHTHPTLPTPLAEGSEEATGASGGGRRSGGAGGKKSYEVGAGDADDDEWLADLALKNKRRDKELWGGDEDPKGGKPPKGRKAKAAAEAAAAAEEEARAARAAKRAGAGGGGAGDPFMLGGRRSRGDTAATGPDRDMDVDSIPIGKLETNELKKALVSGVRMCV